MTAPKNAKTARTGSAIGFALAMLFAVGLGLTWAVAAQAQAPTPTPRPKAPAASTAKAKAAPTSADEVFGGDGDGDGGEPADAANAELIDEGSSGDGLDADGVPDPSTIIDQANAPGPDPGPPRDIRPGSFTLEARLTLDGPALTDGVHWRIFGDQPGSDGKLPLLGEANGGVIYIRLDPGVYFIHAGLGRAGLARRLEVKEQTGGAVFVLNAGGMRLLAVNGKDVPLHSGEVSFDIYAPDEGGSDARYLLIPNAPPGHVLGLTAGIYHVVSHYGDANAVVRADIRVEAGKLTEATVFQRAARLTLKLVEAHGGEALADTAWSVVTTGGESIIESVGAFPTVVLAAGDYTAVAKHDGRTFETNFKVEPAVNRDIEVLLR